MTLQHDVSFLKKCRSEDSSSGFVKIGVAFQEQNGRISVIIDALPIGEWNGKLTLFPKEASKPKG